MDCPQPNAGPAGVQLVLHSVDKSNIKVQRGTATSNHKGEFSFENVFPGKYMVTASHPRWRLTTTEQSIDMHWGNAELPQPFVATGYDVQGEVRAAGEAVAGVEGVDVLLYGAVDARNAPIECPTPPKSAPQRKMD